MNNVAGPVFTLLPQSPTATVRNVLGPIRIHATPWCARDCCRKCFWTYLALDCSSAAVRNASRPTSPSVVPDGLIIRCWAYFLSRRPSTRKKCCWTYLPLGSVGTAVNNVVGPDLRPYRSPSAEALLGLVPHIWRSAGPKNVLEHVGARISAVDASINPSSRNLVQNCPTQGAKLASPHTWV